MFTDIVGSTGLAQRLGVQYPAVVARHFEIIRDELSQSGGLEVKTTGDGVFAVFASPAKSLAAASAIQRATSQEPWPQAGTVSIRIGIHTGEAAVSDADYSGLEVSRAARVADAGHGGQVVLTEATRSLVSDEHLVKSLGEHLLRGIDEPVGLYQLLIEGMPAEFPPLRTMAVGKHLIPVRVASIVGRESDLDNVEELIRDHRLVTVLGPGGVGKTSLVIAVATRLALGFPGGITFVDLTGVSDPELVPPTVAERLELQDGTIEAIAEHFRDRVSLLVIDNLEQVVGAAPHLERLLSSTDRLKVLITSQVPLRLSAERRYVLEPLQVTTAIDSPAVALFMDRARATSPGFDAPVEDVAALVARLDGLPLAIELAAARANLLTPAAMLERLDRGLGVTLDGPDRHASIEGALSWSHGLLSAFDQIVFRRLGVFAGGMTLETAEAVAALESDILDGVAELVDRSLMMRDLGTGRFRMMDGIRRFATRKLEESTDQPEVVERYVQVISELADRAYPGLQSDRGEWFRSVIDEEFDNVRDVLRILFDRQDRERGLTILGNTWRYFHSRGRLVELALWLDRFENTTGGDAPTVGLVKGLMAKGALRYWQQDMAGAVEAYQSAVDAARALGLPPLLADSVFGLATSLIFAAEPEEAASLLIEARALYSALGDSGGVADVVTAEAFNVLLQKGLDGLGPTFVEAQRLYEEAGRSVNATQTFYARAAVALSEGRLEDAAALAGEGIRRGHHLNDVFLVVWGIEYAALIATEMEDYELGGLLTGAAEAARERIGGGWGPGGVGLEDGQTVLQRLVGTEQAEVLIEPGRALSLEEARLLAIDE